MSTFTIYNTQGEQVGSMEQPALFSVEVDEKLIHRYMVWVGTMLRHTLSNTKNRGEVRGGGKKPWKQKGTGRARIGSTRAPHWRKGGIVFGPTSERNWATRMPRSERRKALFSALSSKAVGNSIIVLDHWGMEAPQTKAAIELFSKLPIQGTKVLHLNPEFDRNLFKSTSNLSAVTSKTITAMNVIDILNHDSIVITKAGMEALEQHFTPTL